MGILYFGECEDVLEPSRVVPHPPVMFDMPNGINDVGRDGAPKPLDCDEVRRRMDADHKVGIADDIDGGVVVEEDMGVPSTWVAVCP